MALSKLPTELKELVIDYLEGDRESLCALSKTSKSLHEVSEKFLYRHIQLSLTNLLASQQLLLILLRYPRRAQYIRSITLTGPNQNYRTGGNPDYEIPLGLRRSLRDTFGKALGMSKTLLGWMRPVVEPQVNNAACVALMLYLATRIESIDLLIPYKDHEGLQNALKFIAQMPSAARHSAHGGTVSFPLHNDNKIGIALKAAHTENDYAGIRHVRLQNFHGHFKVLPILESLEIWTKDDYMHQYLPVTLTCLPQGPNLRTVELKNVALRPMMLIKFIAESSLQNLSRFDMLLNLEFHRQFNHQILIQAMEFYLPKLEHLGWTYHPYKTSTLVPVGSLRGLTNLKSLQIDLGMLAHGPRNEVTRGALSIELLPPGLQTLNLFNVEFCAANLVFDVFPVDDQLAPTCEVQEVSFTVLPQIQPIWTPWRAIDMKETREAIQQSSDGLFAEGKDFSVFVLAPPFRAGPWQYRGERIRKWVGRDMRDDELFWSKFSDMDWGIGETH